MVGLAKAKRAKEEEEERPRRAYEEALARYGYEAQVRARTNTAWASFRRIVRL